jgi:hypothetical protein
MSARICPNPYLFSLSFSYPGWSLPRGAPPQMACMAWPSSACSSIVDGPRDRAAAEGRHTASWHDRPGEAPRGPMSQSPRAVGPMAQPPASNTSVLRLKKIHHVGPTRLWWRERIRVGVKSSIHMVCKSKTKIPNPVKESNIFKLKEFVCRVLYFEKLRNLE